MMDYACIDEILNPHLVVTYVLEHHPGQPGRGFGGPPPELPPLAPGRWVIALWTPLVLIRPADLELSTFFFHTSVHFTKALIVSAGEFYLDHPDKLRFPLPEGYFDELIEKVSKSKHQLIRTLITEMPTQKLF